MPDTRLTIGLLADWASDRAEARKVACLVGTEKDYTIHLGGTYFVGSAEAVSANFFPANRGTWPYGKKGSFALPGNHEMYSGGESYFNDLLPFMGTYVPDPAFCRFSKGSNCTGKHYRKKPLQSPAVDFGLVLSPPASKHGEISKGGRAADGAALAALKHSISALNGYQTGDPVRLRRWPGHKELMK